MQVGWVILNGSCMRSSPWVGRRASRRGGPWRPETSTHAAKAAVRKKGSPQEGGREGMVVVVALHRWHHLQRQVRRGGRQHQIVRAVQDACEDVFLRVEELAEVVATQLGARQFPPVVKRDGKIGRAHV